MLTEAMVVGGAELFALRLTDHLQRAGIACDLVCLHADHFHPAVLRTRPRVVVRPARLPLLRWLKRADKLLEPLAHAPLRTRLTTRWIDRHLPAYDIVHSHLFGADWIAAALKTRHPHLRLVSTLHGDYRTFDENSGSANETSRRAHWAERRDRVLGTVDRFVTISAEQQAQFTDQYRIAPERLVDIYNGVERPSGFGAGPSDPPGPFTITMAARGTIPEKGWQPLLEAFELLRGDVRLNLVGEGAYLDELKRRHGSDRRILFAGFDAEPARTMARSHVFALPTTYPAESLPTVISEALSVGCPVVATGVGEIPQMLATDEGPAGTLLEAGSGPPFVSQLRAALQAYIDDPTLRRRHARNATRAFRRFDMDACTNRYRALYEALLGEDPSTSSTSANH